MNDASVAAVTSPVHVGYSETMDTRNDDASAVTPPCEPTPPPDPIAEANVIRLERIRIDVIGQRRQAELQNQLHDKFSEFGPERKAAPGESISTEWLVDWFSDLAKLLISADVCIFCPPEWRSHPFDKFLLSKAYGPFGFFDRHYQLAKIERVALGSGYPAGATRFSGILLQFIQHDGLPNEMAQISGDPLQLLDDILTWGPIFRRYFAGEYPEYRSISARNEEEAEEMENLLHSLCYGGGGIPELRDSYPDERAGRFPSSAYRDDTPRLEYGGSGPDLTLDPRLPQTDATRQIDLAAQDSKLNDQSDSDGLTVSDTSGHPSGPLIVQLDPIPDGEVSSTTAEDASPLNGTKPSNIKQDKPNTNTINYVIDMYTKGASSEKMNRVKLIADSKDMTVQTKLMNIDAILPIPASSSAEAIGNMLGVSKTAVTKTPWWVQNRRRKNEDEVKSRTEYHKERSMEHKKLPRRTNKPQIPETNDC